MFCVFAVHMEIQFVLSVFVCLGVACNHYLWVTVGKAKALYQVSEKKIKKLSQSEVVSVKEKDMTKCLRLLFSASFSISSRVE